MKRCTFLAFLGHRFYGDESEENFFILFLEWMEEWKQSFAVLPAQMWDRRDAGEEIQSKEELFGPFEDHKHWSGDGRDVIKLPRPFLIRSKWLLSQGTRLMSRDQITFFTALEWTMPWQRQNIRKGSTWAWSSTLLKQPRAAWWTILCSTLVHTLIQDQITSVTFVRSASCC